MSFIDTLSDRIGQIIPPQNWRDFSVIIAVSGGPDSVALLRIVDYLRKQIQTSDEQRINNRVIVAHFNHQMRGAESDLDQDFVEGLSQQMGYQFRFRKGKTAKTASEDSLRRDRFRFFKELAEETGTRLIALGHTADDQAETVLFRILRGSGISGLKGIRPMRQLSENTTIVRPLLTIWKQEVLALLDELQQEYRCDHSNFESGYTRNYLRNCLLPELQQRFSGDIRKSLLRLSRQAAETLDYLDLQCQPLFGLVKERSQDHLHLDTARISEAPPILIRHFLRILWQRQDWPEGEMTHQRWEQLADAIATGSSFSLNLPGGVICRREGPEISFVRQG